MNRKRLTSRFILLLFIGVIIGVSVLIKQESGLHGPLLNITVIFGILAVAASLLNDVFGLTVIGLVNKLLGKDPDAHSTSKPEPRLVQRSRQTILLKVKAYWIDGVLSNSLHSKIMPLDMERNPSAVTRPRLMDILWQPKNQSPQPVPPNTKLITLFNHAAGDALLILGDPGSGKTTLLLELARDLLAWAEQNGDHLIPVVFSLSTWTAKQQPLHEWLISELQTFYFIDQAVAQTWIEQNDILPLLDGLDEVAQEHRSACIQAINTYRQTKGTPLVVCSRLTDYDAIGEKLLFSDALLLKSLTSAQINDYLESGGRALDTVRHAIQQDEVFQEMAQSPLLLGLMALTYRDQPPKQFTTTNLDDRRRQLFKTYIERQLSQRQKNLVEDSTTTLGQLSYLAHQMTTRDQTIFLIERIQPTWLPTHHQQRGYHWSFRLVSGLVGWLVGVLLGELDFGLVLGVFVGLLGALYDEPSGIAPSEKVSWSKEHITRSDIFEVLVWGLIVSLLWGLVSALIGELILGLSGLVGGLVYGVFVGLLVALVFGLVKGLNSGLVELRTIPNEGIKNSFLNSLHIGLVFGLVGALVLGLIFGLAGWLVWRATVLVGVATGQDTLDSLAEAIATGLVFGPVVGLGGGLAYGGGFAVIQHYTLRFWLYGYGYLPWNLVPFLDLAAERLILQKVGGGYRFTHRLLQDYLASLDPS